MHSNSPFPRSMINAMLTIKLTMLFIDQGRLCKKNTTTYPAKNKIKIVKKIIPSTATILFVISLFCYLLYIN